MTERIPRGGIFSCLLRSSRDVVFTTATPKEPAAESCVIDRFLGFDRDWKIVGRKGEKGEGRQEKKRK